MTDAHVKYSLRPKPDVPHAMFYMQLDKRIGLGLRFGQTREKNPKPTFFLMNNTFKKQTYTQTDFFILRGFSLLGYRLVFI